MKFRGTWVYIISLIILAFGLWLVVPDRNICDSTKTIEQVAQTCEISYAGVEGETALALLKAAHQVETQSFGDLGEFVQSIDGIQPGATHFWAFYVNGEKAQVGASSYQTKSGETITWKLEAIESPN